MSSDKNVIFTTPVAGYEIKVSNKVLNEIRREGAFVSTSNNGKYASVFAYTPGGKTEYLGQLHTAIKEGRVAYKNGNTLDNSKSNLVVL